MASTGSDRDIPRAQDQLFRAPGGARAKYSRLIVGKPGLWALLKHESFEEGSALIIAPSNAIHTFWMRFAIDVAFVTKEGRVVKVCSSVVPWRIAAAWGGYAVIELPAGALSVSDTRRGDLLQLTSL